MTVEHYIVFIGAGGPLADELANLEGRISNSCVIAPAVKKKDIGVSDAAIELAAHKLHEELSTDDDPSQVARLYLSQLLRSNSRECGEPLVMHPGLSQYHHPICTR